VEADRPREAAGARASLPLVVVEVDARRRILDQMAVQHAQRRRQARQVRRERPEVGVFRVDALGHAEVVAGGEHGDERRRLALAELGREAQHDGATVPAPVGSLRSDGLADGAGLGAILVAWSGLHSLSMLAPGRRAPRRRSVLGPPVGTNGNRWEPLLTNGDHR
jgi:hypothetical protein